MFKVSHCDRTPCLLYVSYWDTTLCMFKVSHCDRTPCMFNVSHCDRTPCMFKVSHCDRTPCLLYVSYWDRTLCMLKVIYYTPRYILYGGYIGVTFVGRSVGRSVCRSVGLWTFLVNTISQQPLVRIQYNFTRMINTKPSCAYCRFVHWNYS